MEYNLLFIGNGFDLYHGLPTRYTDFLEFSQNWNLFYKTYMIQKDDTTASPAQFQVRLDENNRLCENTLLDFASHATSFNPNSIEYLNEHLPNNAWLNFFIASDYKNEGWIDFEKVMKDAIQTIDKCIPLGIDGERIYLRKMKKIEKLAIERLIIPASSNLFVMRENKPYYQINSLPEDLLEQEKSNILGYLRSSMEELNECLRLYLSEFIHRITIQKKSPQIAELENVYLLSVNYTNTFENIYGLTNLKAKHFVHGNANIIPNNIVLGFDPSNLDNLDYVYFFKYFQRIQKRTGSEYKEWMSNVVIRRNPLFIHVFGHSLDITDEDILKDLIINWKSNAVRIYYHNQSSYESQVINLINLFGRDYVIEHVGNGHIQFVKIQD